MNSSGRIRATHVGSLPRPKALLDLAKAERFDQPAYEAALRGAVNDIVRRQIDLGIDVIDDGELSKPNFVSFINERLGGFELGEVKLAKFALRDANLFPEYYEKVFAPPLAGALRVMYPPLVATKPITYTGHAKLKRDIDALKEAAKGLDVELFMPTISPENAEYGKRNEYYATDEEFSIALAEALHEEYKAIVDAGLTVQIDDPQLITYYNRNPDKSVKDVRKWAEGRVEILNHALRGIPEDRIRLHVCYSFDTVPRIGDMEMKDILDILLTINAGAYSFEGANPRHEHEWQLWETTKLPDGKVILPGVVAISTVVVEHPDLVAQRIVRYANAVGRDNVIASADCGFGTVADHEEVPAAIAWAKLEALVEGARRASKILWGR